MFEAIKGSEDLMTQSCHHGQVARRRATVVALCLGLCVLLTAVAMPVAGHAAGDGAAIKSFYATLEKAMKSGGSAASRFKTIKPEVEKVFDLPNMSRAAVGPGWEKLSASDQAAIIAAFGDFSAAQFAKLFDKYTGESFEIGKASAGLVETQIRSGAKATAINYKVVGGRVQDVYLGKTISEIASRRAEFTAVLKSGGVPHLLKTLKAQTSKLLAS